MKRRKRYYAPGLISLFGLPILLFFYWPKATLAPTSISLRLPTDRKDAPGILTFSREAVDNSLKGKKIITIDFDLERSHEQDLKTQYAFHQKLQFITREIERLDFTNDTATILKIQLGADNNYGDFVWVVNQLLLYRIRKFVLEDDNIYVYADPPVDHTIQNLEL